MNKADFKTLVEKVDRKFSGMSGIYNMLMPMRSTDLECAIWWILYSNKSKQYLYGPALRAAWCNRFNYTLESIDQLNQVNFKYTSRFNQTLLDAGILYTQHFQLNGRELLPELSVFGIRAVFNIDDIPKIRDEAYLYLKVPNSQQALVVETQTRASNVASVTDGIARLIVNQHVYTDGVLQKHKIAQLLDFINAGTEQVKTIVRNLQDRSTTSFYYNPLEKMVPYKEDVKYRDIQAVLELRYPPHLVAIGMSFLDVNVPDFDIVEFLESSKHQSMPEYALPELL